MNNKKNLEDFLPKKNNTFFKKFEITKISKKILKEDVINKIKNVMDPEIPVNIYDLGLIYKITIDDNNNVLVEMTLTNPNCPVAGNMPENVGIAISKLDNLASITVNLIWEPKWSKEMMSEDAKLALDIF
tara:strand:+ start:35 stop:424 length:390 start_codon:yes stop_codon:yes gene_type:complete